jgi:hypothetical protein
MRGRVIRYLRFENASGEIVSLANNDVAHTKRSDVDRLAALVRFMKLKDARLKEAKVSMRINLANRVVEYWLPSEFEVEHTSDADILFSFGDLFYASAAPFDILGFTVFDDRGRSISRSSATPTRVCRGDSVTLSVGVKIDI